GCHFISGRAHKGGCFCSLFLLWPVFAQWLSKAHLSDPRVQEQLKEPTCFLPSATELKQGTCQSPFLHLSGHVHLSSDSSHPSSPSLVRLVAVVRVTVGWPFASRGINVSHQQEICQQLWGPPVSH
ncbi:mCG145319, partial [Mus musculus]